MIDVGGQRNERKKWIHCFDDVDAIIYVAAISEYDQVLVEDQSTNRMIESLDLFEELCNSPWFENTDMMLFLNKRDLFESKIKEKSISSVPAFSSYDIKPGYESGCDFFVDQFMQRNQRTTTAQSPDGGPAEKDIYYHITCATDTENVEFVMQACLDIILNAALKDSGFMEG